MADAKSKLGGKQRLRRRYLTWLRMTRYGANNFTRNAWLTTAATAVMTITLLIIFTTFMARSVLSSTVDEFKNKVDFSVNLKTDATEEEISMVKRKFSDLPNVRNVRVITLEESKETYIKQNNPSTDQLQIISELPTSPFFPVLRVVVTDPNNVKDLANLVKNDEEVKEVLNPDPKRAPSFSGSKQRVIETIANWISIADRGGLIGSVLAVSISMLIIFNTIRMAIFNRKEEIQMMKLIGADKGFIRGPFVVEAVMYGFVAALAATGIGFSLLYWAQTPLSNYGIAIGDTLDNLTIFAPIVLLIMIIIGALIGVISSRLAVRRYLKV